ncbi:uncharacterized protein BDZ99DRAFT_516266 [Mytilinidion resinicola]|uniref:Uncharacterized protein n=1 Tax=Mytilinidion resinicola TaxID=574789 RepID=A0A6A6Z5L7_9PEZI|nr:uncharacterized protein BDZ99DRAFT_516266 [Mytilinidion resinicola]KAF2815547.1 hypothetical protein BDZ99DRAFT_516266 [Mytilinidion resinicola]
MDTPFVNVGQDLEDYAPIGTLTSTYNNSNVEYTFEDFTLGSQDSIPSHVKTWNANESRGGGTVSLTMQQHGDEVYHAGAFEGLSNCSPNETATNYNCTGNFGGIVHINDVTGTLSYNDSTVTIGTAYGVHERILQAGAVPSRILNCLGNAATCIHTWGEKIDSWVFSVDFGPLTQSLVNIDGETMATTGIANTSLAETAHWLDPKSNQLVPYKWHSWAGMSKGRIDSYVTAFGRLYYYWIRKGGMIITYQYLANAVTTFTYPNGTTISESQVAFIEYFRTAYISTPLSPA